ncbi:hypothetical protein Tco_0286102 [Tanacetum coccineum]
MGWGLGLLNHYSNAGLVSKQKGLLPNVTVMGYIILISAYQSEQLWKNGTQGKGLQKQECGFWYQCLDQLVSCYECGEMRPLKSNAMPKESLINKVESANGGKIVPYKSKTLVVKGDSGASRLKGLTPLDKVDLNELVT